MAPSLVDGRNRDGQLAGHRRAARLPRVVVRSTLDHAQGRVTATRRLLGTRALLPMLRKLHRRLMRRDDRVQESSLLLRSSTASVSNASIALVLPLRKPRVDLSHPSAVRPSISCLSEKPSGGHGMPN